VGFKQGFPSLDFYEPTNHGSGGSEHDPIMLLFIRPLKEFGPISCICRCHTWCNALRSCGVDCGNRVFYYLEL